MQQRQAVVAKTAARYQRSRKKEKSMILSELGELTEYSRAYARRVLRQHGQRLKPGKQSLVVDVRLRSRRCGPVLLMVGLAVTPASSASLLLNLEGVFTALLAWFVFKENFDRRIALGMAAITCGGLFLSWAGRLEMGALWGTLAISGACLAWAIDNNLTRKVSAGDPVQIAVAKGLVAGSINLTIAFVAGASVPALRTVTLAALVGFFVMA
jgi:hypothetical protein